MHCNTDRMNRLISLFKTFPCELGSASLSIGPVLGAEAEEPA
jgi:hypothetical protein